MNWVHRIDQEERRDLHLVRRCKRGLGGIIARKNGSLLRLGELPRGKGRGRNVEITETGTKKKGMGCSHR